MEITTRAIYSCDICNKEFTWNEQSRSILKPFGAGYAGWEHEFHLCSETCCNALSKLSKTELKKIIYGMDKSKRKTT